MLSRLAYTSREFWGYELGVNIIIQLSLYISPYVVKNRDVEAEAGSGESGHILAEAQKICRFHIIHKSIL